MKKTKGTVYFKIFHQNIRRLGKKAGELLTHLHPDFPHVMCLTEHQLKYLQLEKFYTENYNFRAHYCRQQCEKGGVAVFVHNSLGFTNIHIAQHCKDQDIEICALKLSFGTLLVNLALFYSSSTQFYNPHIHLGYTSLSVGT
jgi:hypothetical protein